MNEFKNTEPLKSPMPERQLQGGRMWRWAAWIAGLGIAMSTMGARAADAVLEGAEFGVQAGNQIQITLKLSGPAPQPSAFSTSGPDRLVIDLPGVKNGLKERTLPIESSVASSLTAVEASDRTRVVVNLNGPVPYEVRAEGDRVLVGVNVRATKPGEAPARSVVAEPAVLVSSERATSKPMDDTLPNTLRNVEFRRGVSGEGRVLITLPSADSAVNVTERGTHVFVDLMDTKVPQKLVRRLEVTDFATPVAAVETRPKNGNVQIDIQAGGDYEFMSYQADDLLTVDIRPLTKAEKERSQREKVVYTGDRLSLNFQNIEVRAILQLLADFTGLNLVASDTVRGNITLRLKNVPWDQALDIILKTKGLSKRQVDNVILVAPTQELAAQERLELESQRQVQELAPLRSEHIQVNYAKAAKFAALLKSPDNRLLSERGNVSVDERTNTLLVQDTAAKLDEIRGLIQKLDTPVRQVMIESRVVIANNDFAKELGVRFGFSRSNQIGDSEVNIGGGQPGNIPGTYFVNKGPFLETTGGVPFNSGYENPTGSGAEALLVNLPAVSPSGSINFLIGKVGSYLLQLELSAMQREGKGEIISNPRVVTSNDQLANIKVGQEIPYQEAAASGRTTVSFKEAVLKLDVTPHITPDDRIDMELKVTKDNPDWSRQVLGVPPIDTRSVNTRVLVDNGETVVLGGVFERQNQRNKEQVPFFGDLPLVGNLFKRRSQIDTNQELLIFVTPKILKEKLSVR